MILIVKDGFSGLTKISIFPSLSVRLPVSPKMSNRLRQESYTGVGYNTKDFSGAWCYKSEFHRFFFRVIAVIKVKSAKKTFCRIRKIFEFIPAQNFFECLVL